MTDFVSFLLEEVTETGSVTAIEIFLEAYLVGGKIFVSAGRVIRPAYRTYGLPGDEAELAVYHKSLASSLSKYC